MGLFDFLNNNKDKQAVKSPDTESVSQAAEHLLENDLVMAPEGVDLNNKEVRQAINDEVKRVRRNDAILAPNKLAQIKDSMQLAQTKLENIESNLIKCRDHQEWLRRYTETQAELEHLRKQQFEINKRVATATREEQELQRYECFETIQGAFQRLQLLETRRRVNSDAQTMLTRRIDEVQKQLAEAEKLMTQYGDSQREAEKQMRGSHDVLSEAYRAEVALQLLGHRRRYVESHLADLTNQQRAVDKDLNEREAAYEAAKRNLQDAKHKAVALQKHKGMVEQGNKIIYKLETLRNLGYECEKLDAKVRDSVARHLERNEQMGKVYSKYRDLENKINQLTDELNMHRFNNHGLDSYTLQSRTMGLRSTRQMMISAQSLWNRIVTGYNLIEEKTQEQNQCRLEIEGLQNTCEALEMQVRSLRQTTREKEYSYTVSKSQSVIQLRADLKEGVKCSVCGASHHPYHSDTMIDQNKLISDIKSEYEQLSNDLRLKERQLREAEVGLAAKVAHKDCLSATLSLLRQRQNEDIKEWSVFAKLDPSFEDCSPSTYLEARTSMLRQLVENLGRDVEEAQKKLDDFNYNQQRINELNEQVSTLEQKKDELNVRLNELNTACQVVAGQVDRQKEQQEKLRDRFTSLRKEIGEAITLTDWEQSLQRGYETVIIQIQSMMSAVAESDATLRQSETNELMAQQLYERAGEQAQNMALRIQFLRELLDDCDKNMAEMRQTLHRLLPETTSEERYEKVCTDVDTAKAAASRQTTIVETLRLDLEGARQRLDEVVEQKRQLDALYVDERSAVDEWVKEFNQSNPPVQYIELERVFSENKDWNEDRRRLRDLRTESMMVDFKVETVRSELVRLQADGYRIPTKDENVQETLSTQMGMLEKQRLDTMMQIANYQYLMDKHAEAIEQQKIAEEEGLSL